MPYRDRLEIYTLLSGGEVRITWPDTMTAEEAKDVREFVELVLRKIDRTAKKLEEI